MVAEPSGGAEAFGAALRELRERAGLSLRQLGRQALYDYTRISRAERGLILIPEEQVRVLDEVLHAGGLLSALRQSAASATSSPAGRCSVTGGGPVIVEVRLPGGGSISVAMSRRQFGQLIAAGTVDTALPPAARCPGMDADVAHAARQAAKPDEQILGYFHRTLTEFYTADKILGPRRLIGPVLAQIRTLDELRRNAPARYAEPVLHILAQYGEMAGWLLQDAGDLGAAANWSRRAAEWAHCAGDSNLAAYMLVRQANIAVLTGDHTAVVQLAAAARREPARIDPKLRALSLQQQARGHARLGEFGEAFALLDRAVATLEAHREVSHPDVPVYLHKYDLGTLREQSAGCHLEAGNTAEAIAILETALAGSDPGMIRDSGHLTAKLAVAVIRAAQPDPDRAAELGMNALGAARETGSVRIIREIAQINQEFRTRWPGHRGGRELREAFAA